MILLAHSAPSLDSWLMKLPKHSFPIGEHIPNTKLTPISLTQLPSDDGGNFAYVLQCDCGARTVQPISAIVRGRVRSCGCGRIERNKARQYTYKQFCDIFWGKIQKSGSCWNWTGAKNQDGYGKVESVLFKNLHSAHRIAWVLSCGEIPKGMQVLHRCDNPSCINPEHLFLGTHTDNVRDCAAKGRIRQGDRRGENSSTSPLKNFEVLQIREMAKSGWARSSIAKEFSVCRQSIDAIVNRKTWTHI